jgi:ATP phosphoribosyltransferase
VEGTETGSTIRAHGLRIIHELMTSCTQLIANKDAYSDPWKKEKLDQIVLLLKGALRAEQMVGLKMNVPAEKLERVIRMLPSLNAPTVAGLYNMEWLSVESMVESRVVRDLIPKLIKAGAEGIIEYPLNKVI